MEKYARIINEETKECSVGLGTNTGLYESIGMTRMDVEQAYNGAWYLKGYAPDKPAPTVQEQIVALENSITARNIRSAIQGDEYALAKIAEIEAQIAELRKQLPEEKEESK